MSQNAKIGKILMNDYPAMLMLIGIVVMWALVIFGDVFGYIPKKGFEGGTEIDSTALNILIAVSAVLTVILSFFSAKRIGYIKRVINSGSEAQGRVRSIFFTKDRGRIEYEYTLKGKSFRSGNAIWKNHTTTQFQEGDAIVLMVDPENPSKAFIADLYT